MEKTSQAPLPDLNSKQKAFLETMVEIIGGEYVASDPSTRYIYSRDLTESEPRWPVGVIMPGCVGEVQEVVREANRTGMPLVPFAYGLNMGGLTIPGDDAVVMDLKRMRSIVEVREEDLYMVVEPGVTFGMIRAHLDEHHPGFRYTYPLAPPQTSAMSNALMDGLNNMSMKHGAMSEWVNGLEVVLPTGELVRVGTCAVVDSWHGRAPLPDLAGLFLGWQGTSGIVTKAALQIWPEPPLRKRFFLAAYDSRTAYSVMRRLCWKEIFDDLACVSWPTGKMLFGARGDLELCPGEPSLFVYGDMYAENEQHLAAKEAILGEVLEEVGKEGGTVEAPLNVDDLIQINPAYAKLGRISHHPGFSPGLRPRRYDLGGVLWPGQHLGRGRCGLFQSPRVRGVCPCPGGAPHERRALLGSEVHPAL